MSPARIMSSTLMVSAQSASAAAASAWLYPRAASAATASPRAALAQCRRHGGLTGTPAENSAVPLPEFVLEFQHDALGQLGAHTRGGGQRLGIPSHDGKGHLSAVSDERMAMATLAPTPLTWVSIRKQLRSVWVEKP